VGAELCELVRQEVRVRQEVERFFPELVLHLVDVHC
jgi:hypothetical protein